MKILHICGPTATGKTALALAMANKLNGELISCDARQVYRDLDIGTGKEVELLQSGRAQKHNTHWIVDGIPLYGYDIISAKDQYDASSFALFARDKIKKIQEKNLLPILVGGTGLYSKITLQGLETYGIGQDPTLRQELENLSVAELTERLETLDSERLTQLNQSDQKNPRRLIRHIEIASHTKTQEQDQTAHKLHEPLSADILKIGLMMDKDALDKRIANRVNTMIDLGLENEIRKLIDDGYAFTDPGLQTIGYSEFQPYFQNQQPLKEVQAAITLHTTQYAKRQMTYFKPDQEIKWFSQDDQSSQVQAEREIISWFKNRKT